MTFKILHEELSDNFNILVCFDINSPNNISHPILLDGCQKVEDGIKYLVRRYQKFDLALCYQDILEYGSFSKRPYQLAQACDGSIATCVLALFYHFCQVKQLSAFGLLKLAYPLEEQDMNFSIIKKCAEWEGVIYPVRWNKKAFSGLLESLTEINYHSLVEVLSDTITIK